MITMNLVDPKRVVDALYTEMDKFASNGLTETGIIYGIQKSIDIIQKFETIEKKCVNAKDTKIRRKCRECVYFRDTWQKLPSGQWGYKDACVNTYSKKLKKRVYPYRDACRMFEDKE